MLGYNNPRHILFDSEDRQLLDSFDPLEVERVARARPDEVCARTYAFVDGTFIITNAFYRYGQPYMWQSEIFTPIDVVLDRVLHSTQG